MQDIQLDWVSGRHANRHLVEDQGIAEYRIKGGSHDGHTFKVFSQKFADGAYSQVDLCVDCQSIHWSRVEGDYDLGHWRDEGGNAGADEMKAYAQMVGYAKEPGR